MKRILAILLSCVMLLSLMPMAAFTVSADYIAVYDPSADEVYVGGVKMTNGTYLAVGGTKTQTTEPSGGYAYFEAGQLTLYNYSYSGAGTEQPFYYVGDDRTYFAAITAGDDLTIRLLGVSTLSVDKRSDDDVAAAICVEGNLTIVDTGTLNITDTQCGIVVCEEDLIIEKFATINAKVSVDGIVAHEGDIIIRSNATLDLKSRYYGIMADSGNITIRSNATVNIESEGEGILLWEGALAIQNSLVNVTCTVGNPLYAKTDLTITDSRVVAKTEGSSALYADKGNVVIQNSYVDAQSDLATAIRAYNGNITIEDSDITAIGGTWAISAKKNLYLRRSAIDAKTTYSGNDATYWYWALYAQDGTVSVETDKYQVVRGYTEADGTTWETYATSNNNNYERVSIVSERYIYVGGVKLTAGEYLANGATKTQTTQLSDKYAYYGADGTLTLKNYSYSGAGYYGSNGSFCGAIVAGEDLTISLIGDNTIDMQNTDDSYAVYTGGALRITAAGDASLSIQNTYEGIDAIGNVTLSSGDVEIVSDSYAIYSEGVVTVTGSNLRATSESDDGIFSDAGVATNGGSMHVTADLTAINTAGSYLQLAGSDVTVEGFNGGISANGVLVSGGNLTATADMQAIYSFGAISMNNCNATFVSTNVSKDDSFAALYSRSGSITIGDGVVATVSRFNDGSSPEPLDLTQFANYDYISLSSPITKLDFYLEGYRAGNTLLGLKILGHENLDRSGYMEMYQKLTEGLYYTFELMLKIDDFKGDPAEDITLDGRKPKSVEVNSDGSGYILYYDLPACPGTTVKGVRVIDLELPVAGEHPDYTATLYNPYTYKFANYGMDGCGFYWLDSEGGVMMPEDTFVAGETYSLEMKFEPNMDNGVTAFDTSSDFYGIVSGTTVNTMVNSKNAYIMDEFVCAAGYPVRVGGVGMREGEYLAVGATETQTTKPSGGYAFYDRGVLTLNNYSYTGEGYSLNQNPGYGALIYSEKYLKIDLKGENTLKAVSDDLNIETVWVEEANCEISSTAGGVLNVDSDCYGIYTYLGDLLIENCTINISNVNVGVCAYESEVTVRNCAINFTDFEYGFCPDGGDLTIADSTVTAADGYRPIYSYEGNLTVSGSTVTTSTTYGISLDYGDCTITDSDLTMEAYVDDGGNGIYTYEGDVNISGSVLDIIGYNGIYAEYGVLNIDTSDVTVDAACDGLWAEYGMNLSNSKFVITSTYRGMRVYDGDLEIVNCELDVKNYDDDSDSESMALLAEGNVKITLGSSQEILASTEPDGTLGLYTSTNHNAYDYIVIRTKEGGLKGDMNFDGQLNTMDALLLFGCINGARVMTAEQEAVADYTADGNINMMDALRLFKTVSGQ